MSTLKIQHTSYHHVPKNAGTTMRAWLNHYLDSLASLKKPRWFSFPRPRKNLSETELRKLTENLPPAARSRLQDRHGLTDCQVLEILETNDISYINGFFIQTEMEQRICIKRDPVERFISCFSDKAGSKSFSELKNVDQFVSDFEGLVLHPLKAIDYDLNYNLNMPKWRSITLARHFAPQACFLGNSPSFYSNVFDIRETSSLLKEFLEDEVYKIKLPLFTKNRKKNKVSLTVSQQDRIAELYKLDYDCGWH